MDFANRQRILRKARLFLVSTVLVSFILSPPVWSQIYKWKDEKGNTHFSDSPPRGKNVKTTKIRTKGEGSSKPEDLRNPQNGQSKEKRPYQDIKVVMYMTDWCSYCKKARELLNSLGVTLVEYNVEKNKGKAEEAQKLGGSGVPVLNIEGVIVKGYNPERIKEAVEKRRG